LKMLLWRAIEAQHTGQAVTTGGVVD